MSEKKPILIWLAQIRANFLLLAVFLVGVGGAAAYHDGKFNLVLFLLTAVGVVLSHISVNLFNEYSDWKTGIDAETERTPFSGGSGMLQSGATKPKQVLVAAIATLFVALIIGLYLCSRSSWVVLIFMICGGIASVFYTTHLAKWLIGEFAAGLTLGAMVVLGTYYVLAGPPSFGIILISITPGILTFLLLLLNEFPDAEADKSGGRRHLVIQFGKRKAARIYVAGLCAAYAIVLVAVVSGLGPVFLVLAFLTVPLAWKAGVGALRHFSDNAKLGPAMGANVGLVLLTDLMLAIGFLI